MTRFFLPGVEDVGPGDSRAAPVIERILALAEKDVQRAVVGLDERFGSRHRALRDTFVAHAEMVAPRLDPNAPLSSARIQLLGAAFTHEYAIEGAALCNPSIVLHPEPRTDGSTAFIMSVRGIGEGHRSTIGFRTGSIDGNGVVALDAVGPFPQTGDITHGLNDRRTFHAHLEALDDDRENASFVLDALPDRFDDVQLEAGIGALAADSATRRTTATTIGNLRALADASYCASFPSSTDVSERVLWPHAPSEAHGMEDARFVRFTHPSGDVVYYATYTAFDGVHITQQLLETRDFRTFNAAPIAGAAAVGKGLAIFPRKINGRFVALSRSDRETNAIAFSDTLRAWPSSRPLQVPEQSWELLQLGNCGSPIETEFGWLVLTHGVGAMRTYSMGAILLDFDSPEVVLARCDEPFLEPNDGGRDGYVPNVVYSCGALAVGDELVVPYGLADQSISFATVSVSELVHSMRRLPTTR